MSERLVVRGDPKSPEFQHPLATPSHDAVKAAHVEILEYHAFKNVRGKQDLHEGTILSGG